MPRCNAIPTYTDWPAALNGQPLYITGAEIMPSSTFVIDVIAQGCDTGLSANFSLPITITTARWGDVVEPFQQPSPAPLTQPNVADIAAVVDKFKAVPTAPIVARCDLQPNVPDFQVNIADVAGTVDAFKNLAYPFPGPSACP